MIELDKIRAVNLGGWFVLEFWMDRDLFKRNHVEGHDETCFSTQVPNFQEELQKHYETFITKEDLIWLKDQGVNLVRLPIPWWLYGEGVYNRSVEFIDKVVDWFEELELPYMLDLHTAPGCQNGFDNGGIQHQIDWPKDKKNIDKTIDVLESIAIRYQEKEYFHSLQLLNEPHVSIDMELLQDFYIRSYKRLRPILKDKYIVMHDGFRFDKWEEFFTKNKFHNVILDTHMYQCFDDRQRNFTVKQHLQATKKRTKLLKDVERYVPVVVGEWSLGLSRNQHITDENHDEVMKQYATAQLEAMRDCKGHIFWAYRVKQEYSGWHFRDLVERGIIQMEEFRK